LQYKNAVATSRSVQRPDAAAFAAAGLDVANPAQIWGSPEVNDDITIFGNVGLDLGNDKEFYMFGNYSERDVRGGFYYRNPHTRGTVYGGSGVDDGVRDDDGEIVLTPTLLVGDLTPGPVGQINSGLGLGDGSDCPIIRITSDNVTTQQNYIDGVQNNANCFAFNEILPGGFTLNASLGPTTPRDFRSGKYIQLEKNFNFDLVKLVDMGLYEDVNVAGGLEWHEQSYEVVAGDVASYTAGPLTTQGFGIGSNGFPGFKPDDAGVSTRRNYAAYIDLEAQVTEALLLGGALRVEDYDTFGSTTNYKISAQFHLTDELSLRSSISSGFRAPTVGQANVSNVQTNLDGGVLVDSALLAPTNPIAIQLGGTELQPEESDSYTLGGVYQGVHVDYDATAITADAAVTVDLKVSYMFSDAITVSVGAQNLFDQEAERINIPADQGIPNNNWGGVYYETSPMGFNGGLYYISANYNF
jgi:iron complex outermembrane receptor protein